MPGAGNLAQGMLYWTQVWLRNTRPPRVSVCKRRPAFWAQFCANAIFIALLNIIQTNYLKRISEIHNNGRKFHVLCPFSGSVWVILLTAWFQSTLKGHPGQLGSPREESVFLEGEVPAVGKCQLPKEILTLRMPVCDLWELLCLAGPDKTYTGTSANAKCSICHGEHRHRLLSGLRWHSDNSLHHGNLVICLACKCICYHSVPCICDELDDMSPSSRHLPEWVMNNHLDSRFIPPVGVSSAVTFPDCIFSGEEAGTRMSEAACVIICSGHPSASLIDNQYFTILPCWSAKTFQWAGVFCFICCYYSSDKSQSDCKFF